jgi:hypothetical protein
MRPAFRRFCFIACLSVSAFLATRPADGSGFSGGGFPSAEEPVLKEDDQRILEIVLLDLLDFEDFHPFGGSKKKAEIVLGVKTAGSSGFLDDGQLDGESYDKNPHLIPSEIRSDLQKRNPKEPISLVAFKPESKKILVSDLEGLYQFGKFGAKHPEARGYVETWLPGYSKDGQSAVLRMSFGPTPHGATATYMLAKKDGRWSVVWRDVSYYA